MELFMAGAVTGALTTAAAAAAFLAPGWEFRVAQLRGRRAARRRRRVRVVRVAAHHGRERCRR
jgi:hypothetical protein